MNGFLIGFAGLCVVIVVILGLVYYFYEPPPVPTHVVDRLCAYVRDEQKMDCVAVLAAETFMKPGAVVEYQGSTAEPGTVPLPIADLFGPSCQLPGVDLTEFQRTMAEPSQVSIPQFTYEANRALTLGTDVEIPKFRGFTFKAGPRWRDVAKIEMTNDDAWVIRLDELAALNAYKSCRIVKDCTDYITASKYRVVGTAIVAKGLSYKVFDKKGKLISLDAGTKSNDFTVDFGGTTDINQTTDATIKAAGPRVIGVRLIPANVFSREEVCGERWQFQTPTATVQVSVAGGGGKGSITPMNRASEALGQTVQVAAQGTERNECNEGAHRTSRASAEARVEADGPGVVNFSYKLMGEGGQYETAERCRSDGGATKKTTHETSATASADMTVSIFVLIRTRSAPNLRVDYGDMPPSAAIQVVNWKNERLKTVRTEYVSGDRVRRRENMPDTVSGSGSNVFETSGPGLYRVEAKLRLNQTVTGAGKDQKSNKEANVRVNIEGKD